MVYSLGSGTWNETVRNCIVYGLGSSNRANGFQVRTGWGPGSPTINLTLQNNSISRVSVNAWGCGFNWAEVYNQINIISTNNIAVGNTFDFKTSYGSPAVTQTYCLSADATADDWGGAGNLVSQTAADVFENVASDLSLKDGSPACWAGTNLYAQFQTDAIGNPWPTTADWDMGALVAGPGYYLYRGIGGMSNVDFTTPVGTVIGAASSETFTGLGHETNTRYTYVLRPWRRDADGDILETPDLSCRVEFETDGDTEWLGNRPGQAEYLEAEVISGAQVRLRWRYRTPYGGAAPSDFGIYYQSTPDITPGSPQTTESYTKKGSYSKTLSLVDGTTYYFAITARTAAGVESHLSNVIGPYIADDTAPDTPTLMTSTTF